MLLDIFQQHMLESDCWHALFGLYLWIHFLKLQGLNLVLHALHGEVLSEPAQQGMHRELVKTVW